MVSNDKPWTKRPRFEPDEVDLEILSLLAEDGGVGYTELAKKIGVDKRTVAKHAETMKERGVLKIAAEIDWAMLGIGAHAFVGTQTEVGEAKDRLYEFIRREPRVVEAYSTVGSGEYFFVVLEEDIQGLREDVLRSLEPLTADLTTAIVSTRIKERNYSGFIEFIRNRRKTTKVTTKTR
ncbi:MAG: Lrp/AsnC family transcriptional regulator [Thaumarchaeota archaeon]|nr:Lrp/AsnC family transcriptional regulator [Nitrososphaerota archaeon]